MKPSTPDAGPSTQLRNAVFGGSLIKFVVLTLACLPGIVSAQEMPPPGFAALFDGKSFAGWKLTEANKAVWSVDSGHFLAKADMKGAKLDLWSDKSYRDFELRVDWRLPKETKSRMLPTFTTDGLYARDDKGAIIRKEIPDAGDSGIYMRGSSNYQVNIWSQPMGSGDIQELHKDEKIPAELRRAMLPKVNADAPFGEWNHYVITLKGERVTVVLNGQTVIDKALLPGIAPAGPIALQYHGDQIEFANLFIKEL